MLGRSRVLAVAALMAALVMGLMAVASLSARAASPCASAPAAGSSTVTLAIGGTDRTALVHVPPGLVAGHHVPLVLALHGYGGSGPKMQRYSGFSALADRHRFVVAYPSSEGLYWNSTAAPGLPDDVTFLRALIGELERTLCVDRARVFATGVSNGGGMVALLGCDLSARIAAIASVAGAYNGQPACRPARPISVLEIHGTADQVVPYFGPRRRRSRDGLPPFVNGWARRDHCVSGPIGQAIAVRTTLFRFGGCAAGASVEHIRIRRGRHQWPGATPPDPGPRATICASCVVWRFFAGTEVGSRDWGSSPVRQSDG